MFTRVQTFGKDNAADFAAGGDALKHLATLTSIIGKLDEAKAGQASGGSATARSVLLDALRLDQQAIAPPPPSSSDRDLLTTADLYLSRLQGNPALAAKFIAKELPANFVQDLADDRAAIVDAAEDQEGAREDSISSTSAVGRLIKDGMKEINYLDAIMNNKYARNADKLRAWQSASHIERTPQRAKKPVPLAPQA